MIVQTDSPCVCLFPQPNHLQCFRQCSGLEDKLYQVLPTCMWHLPSEEFGALEELFLPLPPHPFHR